MHATLFQARTIMFAISHPWFWTLKTSTILLIMAAPKVYYSQKLTQNQVAQS